MRRVFADTAFYVALVSPSDAHHSDAVEIVRRSRFLVLTTDFVLLETGNSLSRSSTRVVFLALMEQVAKDEYTEVIPATRELLYRGQELYRSRPDKDWSLTDCTSMVAMREAGLDEVLTLDRHFVQAGFKVPMLAG